MGSAEGAGHGAKPMRGARLVWGDLDINTSINPNYTGQRGKEQLELLFLPGTGAEACRSLRICATVAESENRGL